MGQRWVYAVVGGAIALVAGLALELLGAAVQQLVFGNQFSWSSVWYLGGLALAATLAGALIGWYLGGEAKPQAGVDGDIVTTTRLRARLSKVKLRGEGIRVDDVKLRDSTLDIDTRD